MRPKELISVLTALCLRNQRDDRRDIGIIISLLRRSFWGMENLRYLVLQSPTACRETEASMGM